MRTFELAAVDDLQVGPVLLCVEDSLMGRPLHLDGLSDAAAEINARDSRRLDPGDRRLPLARQVIKLPRLQQRPKPLP